MLNISNVERHHFQRTTWNSRFLDSVLLFGCFPCWITLTSILQAFDLMLLFSHRIIKQTHAEEEHISIEGSERWFQCVAHSSFSYSRYWSTHWQLLLGRFNTETRETLSNDCLFLSNFSCLFFGSMSNLGRSSRSPRCRASFSLSNAVSGIVASICLRKWWSSTFPSRKWKRTAETPARLKSHVIFMTNGIVSSHFTHADHE